MSVAAGDWAAALARLEQAAGIVSNVSGESSELAAIWADMGSVAEQRGEWAEAERRYGQVLSLRERLSADDERPVTLLDRDAEKGEALAKELGANPQFVEVDVCDEASIANAIGAAQKKWGKLNGLVNCAGVGSATSTIDKKGRPHDMEMYKFVINLNLVGTFSVCAKVAAVMAKQESSEDGERGILINVASVAAFDGQNGQAAYSASKSGVCGMALPMARDLGRWGIRVNVIAPGIMRTPMTYVMPEKLKTALANSQVFPNTRLGTPEDFGSLACHIIENRFINAECIRCDAGVRMPKL